jgi:hypothetical protein
MATFGRQGTTEGAIQRKWQHSVHKAQDEELDICDADNHRIESCSLTEHHLFSGNWN